jgi:hypothetical protein
MHNAGNSSWSWLASRSASIRKVSRSSSSSISSCFFMRSAKLENCCCRARLAKHTDKPPDFFQVDPESDEVQKVQHELLDRLLHKVCQNAIYVDRTFNAAHFLQSEDRIHRLGQVHSPTI